MQVKRRGSEAKWKEGVNGRQGGSNETEERKEAVKVKEREVKGVNRAQGTNRHPIMHCEEALIQYV